MLRKVVFFSKKVPQVNLEKGILGFTLPAPTFVLLLTMSQHFVQRTYWIYHTKSDKRVSALKNFKSQNEHHSVSSRPCIRNLFKILFNSNDVLLFRNKGIWVFGPFFFLFAARLIFHHNPVRHWDGAFCKNS